MPSLYDFNCRTAAGTSQCLSDYQGCVVLIVNTASRCAFTSQYHALQQLHAQYQMRGLEILDFPCNQFRQQAPQDSNTYAEFCQQEFGVQFAVFDKVDVNGAQAHPLFTWLKQQQPHDQGGSWWKSALLRVAALGQGVEQPGDIRWNFTKFLVDRQGQVIARFAPDCPPEHIAPAIEQALVA